MSKVTADICKLKQLAIFLDGFVIETHIPNKAYKGILSKVYIRKEDKSGCIALDGMEQLSQFIRVLIDFESEVKEANE